MLLTEPLFSRCVSHPRSSGNRGEKHRPGRWNPVPEKRFMWLPRFSAFPLLGPRPLPWGPSPDLSLGPVFPLSSLPPPPPAAPASGCFGPAPEPPPWTPADPVFVHRPASPHSSRCHCGVRVPLWDQSTCPIEAWSVPPSRAPGVPNLPGFASPRELARGYSPGRRTGRRSWGGGEVPGPGRGPAVVAGQEEKKTRRA